MFNIAKSCTKKGFTLLELLVVVSIIGILASIALPQYNKAVAKTRISEVLINIKAIQDSMTRYILANGFPSEKTWFQNFGDIELSGGKINDNNSYQINKDLYFAGCTSHYCEITVYTSVVLEVYTNIYNETTKLCITNKTEKGRFICTYLESFGWQYVDEIG